jgi:hypothetical protein
MGKEQGATTFKRLIWLLDTIRRSGEKGISRSEVSERWQAETELSGGEEYALRTFRNHIDRDIPQMFDVEIECTKANKYRIKYPDDLKRDALTGWLLETISLKNAIAGNTRLRDRILFEPVPAGEQLLRPILDAIGDAVTVRIVYQRFHEDSPSDYLVDPYALKLFRRRWYLVGRCHEMGRIYTFSLDRLRSLNRTDERFPATDGDEATDFFGNSFGIIWGGADNQPAIVKIRVYGEQVDYIRSLPLHSSQKETAGVGYSDFEYFVLVTYDLIQELLSHGKNLEILSPEPLRQEIKRHAEAMVKFYR